MLIERRQASALEEFMFQETREKNSSVGRTGQNGARAWRRAAWGMGKGRDFRSQQVYRAAWTFLKEGKGFQRAGLRGRAF